jgi:hypothetical protein
VRHAPLANVGRVPYSTAEGRAGLLDQVAVAVDRLAVAIGLLSAAYELLDERSAEQMEEQLFGPVQHAYGLLRRTYAGFAQRHDLPVREFVSAAEGAPARGVRGLLEGAAEAVGAADQELASLQDSMLPVEVGDVELRAGLEHVRGLIGQVGANERRLMRTFGR